MLEKLCNLNGVSGFEDSVREFLTENIKSGEKTVDAQGNLIVYKKGRKSNKKLMCCAHMDEVGLMVSEITDKGLLKFKSCGGIEPKVLLSKRVRIGARGIPGVISYKAVHLQEKSERDKIAEEKRLFADIGAESREEAEEHTHIGDFIAFDTVYSEFGDGLFKAKAIDDRAGCACLMKLLERDYDYDFYGVFTTGEEIGGVGARCAAERIRPDMALVLEGTTCSDVYGTEEHKRVTKIGDGVCIPVRDRSMVANKEMVSFLIDCAEKNNIPWQYKHTTAGGTDGGVVHVCAGGIRCAVIALPCRYIHSPVSVAGKKDYKAFLDLAEKFTENAGEIL